VPGIGILPVRGVAPNPLRRTHGNPP
jgi:hypothetical protein